VTSPTGPRGKKGQLSMFNTPTIAAETRDRLKRLRLLRRWDQAELAARAGVSAATVSNIELGRVAPTDQQIETIAAALGYSASFVTASLGTLPTTRPWLRAYADASKKEADARAAATSTAAEYIRVLRLKPLPDLIPRFAGSLDDEEAIDAAAAELRELAQLEPNAVVANAMRAAERLGCVVLPLESELGRHVGMSVWADQIPMMCIARDDVPGDRQRWTVAHELGHLTLHGEAPPPRDGDEARRMEDQANRFAAAFLTPAEAVVESLQSAGGTPTLRALAEVKAEWGVSIKSLVGRFRELGVIEPDHARSLYKQISARKWTKEEPVNVATESAQWLEKTLTRKAGTTDLKAACDRLASSIGGNSTDLVSFADWTPRVPAEVVLLDDRRAGRIVSSRVEREVGRRHC
jgi:Zn-dependent peptidase ImmA (M78 family)/DNA-binding XRE family transcriptional regulator